MRTSQCASPHGPWPMRMARSTSPLVRSASLWSITSETSIRGCAFSQSGNRGRSQRLAKEGEVEIVTERFDLASRRDATTFSIWRSPASVALRNSSPCGVNTSLRCPLASRTRTTPIHSFSSATWRLTDECAMPSSRAAARMPPFEYTDAKARSAIRGSSRMV